MGSFLFNQRFKNMIELKNIFSGIETEEFNRRFTSEEACFEFLAMAKWQGGFECRKCGHTNFCKGKIPFSRRCTRCKHEESAMAHTPFHGCKMPLVLAFQLAFNVCCEPGISSYKLSDIHSIRQMTCWKLKKKIMQCVSGY